MKLLNNITRKYAVIVTNPMISTPPGLDCRLMLTISSLKTKITTAGTSKLPYQTNKLTSVY